MAKSKNSQEVTQPPKSQAEIEADRMLHEMKSVEQMAKFELKVEDMAYRAADYYERYGEDDYRTVMLMTFLDVSLQMKESITNMNDIKNAITCITDSIQCIDNVYTELSDSLSSSLQQDYSLRNRIQQKRKLKKIIRNNVGRMIQITDLLIGSHDLAMQMISAMQKVGIRLKYKVDKMNIKKMKANKRSGKKGQPSANQDAGKTMVMEILKKRRGDSNDGKTPSTTAGGSDSSSSTPSGGADGVNVDDIL